MPVSRRRLDEILGNRSRVNIDIDTKKIQFFQLLTKEEYEYVLKYINENIKREDRDRAIYLIVREINGDK